MEVRKVFRNLVTNQYMTDFDYKTWYTFQTVFYSSPYSYCCCPCAFQHEFIDYIDDNGRINEETYQKIVQSIEDGKCPHVSDTIATEWLRETKISATHIARIVGTTEVQQTVADVENQVENNENESMGTSIFNIQLHEIALIKKKYLNFNFPNRVKDVLIPVEISSSTAVIKKVPFLEVIIQTDSEDLLHQILTTKHGMRLMVDNFKALEDFIRYLLKKGPTELQGCYLEFIKKAMKLRQEAGYPSLFDELKYAILYNNPTLLETLLQNPFYQLQQCWNFCNLLYRPDCKNILNRNMVSECSPISIEEIQQILDILIFTDIPHDFVGEFSTGLQKIPDVEPALLENLCRHPHAYNPDDLRRLLGLNVLTDADKIFNDEDSKKVFMLVARNCLFLYERGTAKLLVENNLCFDIPVSDPVIQDALRDDIGDLKRVQDQSFDLNKDLEQQIFQTDVQENGRWMHNTDFALNFKTPFLLECGLSVSRDLLNCYLKEDLHPKENLYLKTYIQENFVNVKPLVKMCRNVLRKHFQGRRLHKYLELATVPQTIKDYVLMKYLLD